MFSEFKISPGVGISILIGAVGSIYLVVQSHRYFSKLSQRRRSEITKSDVDCHICNANIDVKKPTCFATCRGCERLVCKNDDTKCCEWIPAIGIWECQNCRSSRAIQQKAGEWLLNQLTIRLQNPGPVNLKNDTLLGLNFSDSDDGLNSSCSISSNQKVKVREFIEELLSSMLNGPLDDVSVGQLMQNENYLPLCEGQKVPDSPSDKHFELRKLVQRVLDEVAKLPEMLNHSGLPLRPEEHLPYFSPKKYEQLLATAVLNKVVEDYRNPKNFEDVGKNPEQPSAIAVPPTNGAVTTGSAPTNETTTFDINHNKVPGINSLNEINIRQMSLNTEQSQSPEDKHQRSLSESDESYLSDYIQKHTVPLPDLSDTNGSGSCPEDDLVSLKSNTTEGTSWEENWLFRKRQLKATESVIAMLVPSPTEEVKALIGDQIVDDVSDLSEAASDVEDYESDSNNADTSESFLLNHSEAALEDPVQDSLISLNSIPSNEPTLSEAKNSLLLAEAESSTSPDRLLTDLISIQPSAEKVEASNHTLLCEEVNNFHLRKETQDDESCTQKEAVETDDVKLLQERIQNSPMQRDSDGNVLYPIGVARSTNVASEHTDHGRKEIPIDRESQPPSTSVIAIEPPINTDGTLVEENFIPGSNAERDILKWRNASPIPNNPYSADVLQKRLSESNRKSNLMDLDRLTNKDADVPTDCHPNSIRNDDKSDEQNRSLQLCTADNPTQHHRYGRDYYINDAKRASGSRKDDTTISHSTDDEKVSQQTYFLSTNTYIMEKFLNTSQTTVAEVPTPPVSFSPEIPLKANLTYSLARSSRFSPRPASVDLGYITKASSNADSDNDIPENIISQFEQEMLHNNFKRDSFRARNASTRHFVLNPIFDEYSCVTSNVEKASNKEKFKTLPKNFCNKLQDSGSDAMVETVFTDLGTLRRSASHRGESNSRPVIYRSVSGRSNISK